jgi:hypothetical protein
VVHTYNPSSWETETGGPRVRDQPGLELVETDLPCLKKK